MTDNERVHVRLSVIWWSALFVALMYLMLVTANNKTIVIADGTYGEETALEGGSTGRAQRLGLESAGAANGIFLIPLEENTKPENVVVENRYMDKELHILIKGAREDFYGSHTVQGDIAPIQQAYWEKQRSGVLLRLQMSEVYEYRTSMDGNILRVEVCDPHEIYQMLVVIDPAGGGPISVNPGVADYRNQIAAEIMLEVAKRLPEQLDSENIRLYFTRTADEEVSAERRAALVEDVGADLFLYIDTAADEDTSQYGIRGYYNEAYFIPGFGNVELADLVTRKVTLACGNRAIGLEPAGEESVLQSIRVPAAGIELGYMTNVQESALLSRSGYQESLAAGIAEALREVYASYYREQ
ncbi:MAG: N-acetylmuramoyl-L-alanine amidase [Butyrivibrio sp.]|nr:N-acetylmuramoyl-L-alanine amidase [Muribaculum sp.]MCM1552878.1 N-acetylmuramoyl-L-alanine amidase [Butyrivibrio sp.]